MYLLSVECAKPVCPILMNSERTAWLNIEGTCSSKQRIEKAMMARKRRFVGDIAI
jgi:hypothetical protein